MTGVQTCALPIKIKNEWSRDKDSWCIRSIILCDSNIEAISLEFNLIHKLNAVRSGEYLNMSNAGMTFNTSGKSRKHSDETKKRISNSSKGENNPHFGKKHTLTARQAISEYRKTTIWVNDGKKNFQYDKFKPLQMGYSYGRLYNKFWINNGVYEKQLSTDQNIPKDWTVGRIRSKRRRFNKYV